MPIYEYKCKDCGVITELLQGVVKDKGIPKCKSCGSTNVTKLFSSFAVANKESLSEDIGSCCGLINPCDNPKRCCQN